VKSLCCQIFSNREEGELMIKEEYAQLFLAHHLGGVNVIGDTQTLGHMKKKTISND